MEHRTYCKALIALLVIAMSNLIVPPIESRGDGNLTVNLRAPISQWVVFDHYQFGEDCEAKKIALVQ
jgi:hypothetical protein